MAGLSTTDRSIITAMLEAGVLQKIEAHRLDHTQGAIMVSCADGDQIEDIWKHHADICRTHRENARIHTLTLNGGALLLAEGSPLVQLLHEDEVLLHHITVGRRLKNIDTIALYTHLPCGAAGLAGFSVIQLFDHLMSGKQRLKRLMPDAKIACFCHVDKGEDGKRTYFISLNDWLRWRQSR